VAREKQGEGIVDGNRKFLIKGRAIKKGDAVKTLDRQGAILFYRVVSIWGSHAVLHVISEHEAGQNANLVSAEPETR
jgi:hypothetical protein